VESVLQYQPFPKIFAIIGTLYSIKFVYKLLRTFLIYFLIPAKSFTKHRGNWAVVTGASWGIGYGFAISLAKRGMNVVLLARSEQRLKEVAEEIESKYKVKTKVVIVDFGSKEKDIYKKIEEELIDLNVTMLINNVGINTQYPKFFLEIDDEEIDNLVHVNINSLNRMTKLILPKMKEKKFGTIINVSSASANMEQPTPLFNVYAGTKSYIQKFSMSLAEEYSRDGIEVLAVTPYFVTSKMTRQRNASLLVCSEHTHAEQSLNKLGYNMKTVIPWFNHYLQYVITTTIPLMNWWAIKTTFAFRIRAINKIAEKEKEKATQKKTE